MQQLPSVDIFIGLLFIVGIGYGLILRRDKTITTLCSAYIGLVIASSFSETVFKFFNGNATIANQIWIRSNASVSTISIILFLLCIFLISGAIQSSSTRSGDIGAFEVFIYSSLTVALVISSVLYFLPPETRANYTAVSRLAKMMFDFRPLIIIGAPLTLIILNFRKK
ncbi:MAG: hypothetical protein WC536_00800 [Patescibacteria group bacterium]